MYLEVETWKGMERCALRVISQKMELSVMLGLMRKGRMGIRMLRRLIYGRIRAGGSTKGFIILDGCMRPYRTRIVEGVIAVLFAKWVIVHMSITWIDS